MGLLERLRRSVNGHSEIPVPREYLEPVTAYPLDGSLPPDLNIIKTSRIEPLPDASGESYLSVGKPDPTQ